MDIPENKKNFINRLIGKRGGYLFGVLLGLSLLIVNVYIGLSMIDILLDGEDTIAVKDGISLPAIRENDYNKAKEEYIYRQNKAFTGDLPQDPFRL